jgi:hypothetical protein
MAAVVSVAATAAAISAATSASTATPRPRRRSRARCRACTGGRPAASGVVDSVGGGGGGVSVTLTHRLQRELATPSMPPLPPLPLLVDQRVVGTVKHSRPHPHRHQHERVSRCIAAHAAAGRSHDHSCVRRDGAATLDVCGCGAQRHLTTLVRTVQNLDTLHFTVVLAVPAARDGGRHGSRRRDER